MSKSIKVVGRRALIGRGFLGGVLDEPGRWTDRYHSKNIHEMSGDFDLVVIAAPGATKWWVNEHPYLDSVACREIVDAIQRVSAREVVLLSSIDAGRPQAGVYGKHRKSLEQRLSGATIFRLPALYGNGLRKNALYDLLSCRPVPNQVYQWYNVGDLWNAIRGYSPGLGYCLYSAPLSMWEIADRLGLTDLISQSHDPKQDYNEPGPFTLSSEEVLEDIVRWAKNARQ